ncbi:hypothetical protein Scel_59250 [Streptomyces cellostaticus]|nr:hypothetical protein Scel_59250 [Streptomyces cellostaticus]
MEKFDTGIAAARARTLVGFLRVRAAFAVVGITQHTAEPSELIQDWDVQIVRCAYGVLKDVDAPVVALRGRVRRDGPLGDRLLGRPGCGLRRDRLSDGLGGRRRLCYLEPSEYWP